MDFNFLIAFPVLWPLTALYNTHHIHPFTLTFIHWWWRLPCEVPAWSSGAFVETHPNQSNSIFLFYFFLCSVTHTSTQHSHQWNSHREQFWVQYLACDPRISTMTRSTPWATAALYKPVLNTSRCFNMIIQFFFFFFFLPTCWIFSVRTPSDASDKNNDGGKAVRHKQGICKENNKETFFKPVTFPSLDDPLYSWATAAHGGVECGPTAHLCPGAASLFNLASVVLLLLE